MREKMLFGYAGHAARLATALFFACVLAAQARAGSLEENYRDQLREIRLITTMESDLFAASEAEKLAVMADTDEDSRAYADKTRGIEAGLEASRVELEQLVKQGKLDKEQALLAEFDTCWAEFRKLDARVLELAVQNTNLKAARLSHGRAMDLLARFKQALDAVGQGGQADPRLRELEDRALLAAREVQILQAPHIDEDDPAKMDALEARMKDEEAKARQSLNSLGTLAGAEGAGRVQAASAVWDEYVKTTAEIVALSRENTNLDSFKLSLGHKRTTSVACAEILAALKKAAFDREVKATR